MQAQIAAAELLIHRIAENKRKDEPMPKLMPKATKDSGRPRKVQTLPLYCADGTYATPFYQRHGIVVKKQLKRYQAAQAQLYGHSLTYNRHTKNHCITADNGKIIATFVEGGALQIR